LEDSTVKIPLYLRYRGTAKVPGSIVTRTIPVSWEFGTAMHRIVS